MIYTLYIAENCHECEEVTDYISASGIELTIINVDKQDEKPPIQVFAFPALFKGDILLRYGSDIMEFFEKQK